MLYSGRLIWNIRGKLEISSEVLAKGLCARSYLTHIENNKRDADKLLFESLYQRLGKFTGRFEMLLDADEYRQLQKRWEICDLIDCSKYEEAKSKVGEYKKGKHGKLEKQYLCLLECEIMHKSGVDMKLCQEKILEGIKYTQPK